MANVNFYLKTQKNSESLIFAVFNFGYSETDTTGNRKPKFFKYSTGETIKTIFWNPKTQRAKETLKFPGYAEFNTRLDNITNDIKETYRRLQNDRITPSPDLLRTELDKLYKKTPQPPEPRKIDLFGYIDNYIKTVKFVYKGNKPFPINERTKQKYRTTLNLLKEFAKEKRKNKLNFDDINLDFYNAFLEYLQTKLYTDNTCGKYIANIKKFLNTATEEGVNTKLDYQSKRFAKPFEETEKMYLTETELLKLYELDLTKNKRLQTVRDLFLIGCYTALRYSDYSNIKPENIYTTDKGIFLNIKTFKTGKTVIIPLHWIVKNILDKYHNELPRSITNQKTNDYLKELGELAGIYDKVNISQNKGGVRVDITNLKYELITTHTARRSGATNMYLTGIPVQSIMKLTGHKTEKVFMSYLRFTEEDNANILFDSPFFKPQSNLKVI